MLLKEASKMFPEHIIAGNIDPATIQEDSWEDVLKVCCNAVDEGRKHPGGYVLMPGCEIPPMASPVNVYMMVKASLQ